MSADDVIVDLAHEFANRHPREAGQALVRLPGEQSRAFLASAPTETAAAVLEQLSLAAAGHYVEDLEPDVAARLLSSLPDELAVELLRDMEPERRLPVLDGMPPSKTQALSAMLDHPPGTVGAIMRQRPPAVRGIGTAGQVLDELRRQRLGAMSYVYVVDDDGILEQVVTLGALVAADPQADVAAMALPADARVRVDATIAAALENPGWQQHASLPVVDGRGMLVGGLEYRTLLRHRALADAEAEDISVGASLGELYQLGLSGFLRAATGGGRDG